MDTTHSIPNVPLKKFKRTKIIATIGPATNSYEAILGLMKAGANGLRLNFSHGTYEERQQQIEWIRKAGREYGKPVAIIQDLQGPKIRLGDFDGIVNVQKNQDLVFGYNADLERTGVIPTQYDLSKKVKRGERLLLFDGRVRLEITSARDGLVHARAGNDGVLIKRKGINLPDTDFAGDIITKKDKQDIAFGVSHDIDYVALSFVQSAADITKLRTLLKNLGSDAKIIAKIETKAAVENIEEVVEEADMVMVARGDLAIETEPESVPIVQRQIIGLGLHHETPTIVATQMLASMTEVPDPTRAEVSDIATAVALGTDCVMLSDETANGRFPLESVQIMKRVIVYVEAHNPVEVKYQEDKKKISTQSAISSAIIRLATAISANAIVAETKSGATAIHLAARRSNIPLIAVTSSKRTGQQLAIVYGVKSYIRPAAANAASKLTDWLKNNNVLQTGDVVVSAFGKYPGVVGTTDTIKVRIL